MTTGELIRAARKKAGLTQKELGAKLGISGAMIAQYETGVRNPKIDTLKRIAKLLDVLWFELYSDSYSEQDRVITEDIQGVGLRNEYTDAFFAKELWQISETRRHKRNEEERRSFASPEEDKKDALISMVVTLATVGIYPENVPTLIAVGFTASEAVAMYNTIHEMKDHIDEIVSDIRSNLDHHEEN